MLLDELTVYLALAAACFLVRVLPRLRLPDVLLSDTYFHLLCARVIRENGYRLPPRLPRIVLAHEHTYPFLYHYLLAALPLPQRLWLERSSGAIFDTASLVVVCVFMAGLEARGIAPGGPQVSWLVAVLFAFAPALLRIGSGPRAYNGNPRPAGQFLYLVHVVSAYWALSASSGIALTLSVLAGAAAVVTAKFSTQVLLFFAPFFAVIVSPAYLAIAGSSIVAAIVLSGGRAWRVLVGHYRHSRFYVSCLQSIFIQPVARSLRDYARSFADYSRALLTRGAYKLALEWYFTESHPLHLLLTVATPFLALPLIAGSGAPLTDIERFLLAWCLAAMTWFVLTKLKFLMFLGEGERYLEYAMFPALYLAVSLLWDRHPGWIYGYAAYSLLAAAFYIAYFHRRYTESAAGSHATERAFEQLNRMAPGVVLPIGSVHWKALYHAEFPVLTIGVNVDEALLAREEFMLVLGRYPYPSADFERIVERYNVAYIVSDPFSIRQYTERILRTPDEFHGRVRTLFDSSTLLVYQVLVRK